MRAFVALRKHLTDYSNLKEHIAQLEKEMNIKFKDILQAMNYLLQKDKGQIEQDNRKRIGFKTGKKISTVSFFYVRSFYSSLSNS